MVLLRWLISGVGAVIVVVALLDIVLTVLHSQKESRISGAFNRCVWTILRTLARMVPRRKRHVVLAWSIPAMIGGIVATWLALLIVGYALIYLPWIGDRRHFLLGDRAGSYVTDALYFSGVSLSTVGYGDLTPLTPAFRWLGVSQGLTGIVVITMSITYLLTLYPSVSQKNLLAETLNQETDGHPDGLLLIARYLRADKFDVLADRLVSINEQLLMIAEAHRFHSVLYYSHPIDAERSLARLLVTIRGILTTLKFGLYHPETNPERAYWNDPRVQTLESSYVYTLHTLANSIHVGAVDEIGENDDNRALLVDEYARIRSELYRMGLIPEEANGAVEEYIRYRIAADNYVNAYVTHSGYTTEEVEREVKCLTLP